MNELKIFDNEEFGSIRTVSINDEPYFVGKDIANILGYKKLRNAISTHVEPEDALKQGIPTNGGIQEATLINESGLYSLVMSSKLPTAKRFKHWVTSEVLPAIRKTGGYIGDTNSMTDMEILSKALLISQKTIAERDRNIKELERCNGIMQPKAEYFDDMIGRNGLTNFRETSKMLHVAPMKFIEFLKAHKFIYRGMHGKWMPLQNKNKGLFEVREWMDRNGDGYGLQTLITAKGRRKFYCMINHINQMDLFDEGW